MFIIVHEPNTVQRVRGKNSQVQVEDFRVPSQKYPNTPKNIPQESQICTVSLGSCIGSCGQGLVCQLVQIRTGKMPQVDQSLNDIH